MTIWESMSVTLIIYPVRTPLCMLIGGGDHVISIVVGDIELAVTCSGYPLGAAIRRQMMYNVSSYK